MGVHKRPQTYNAYYVSVFDFSTRLPLNLQSACAQVREPCLSRPLTVEEQESVVQSVDHQQLWWSLTESTARLDLVEVEEWMTEQEDGAEEIMVGPGEQLVAAPDRRM